MACAAPHPGRGQAPPVPCYEQPHKAYRVQVGPGPARGPAPALATLLPRFRVDAVARLILVRCGLLRGLRAGWGDDPAFTQHVGCSIASIAPLRMRFDGIGSGELTTRVRVKALLSPRAARAMQRILVPSCHCSGRPEYILAK